MSATPTVSARGQPPEAQLEALARRGRALVIESVARAGGGHVGGPLSAMDILVALYFRVLRIRPDEPGWPERDRFVLSKGHASMALYATMALRGYFPIDELATFDAPGSRLQGHPDMTRLPGLDASTGSLGQGISVALGMALGARLRGLDAQTFVLLGDGELQEGQVWEAIHVSARYGLGNLTAIVDRNGMQQWGWPLEPGAPHRGDRRDPWAGVDLAAALEALGWRAVEVDGHDIAAIVAACEEARLAGAGPVPTAILARTVKGRGVSFVEGRSDWHTRAIGPAELEAARRELADPTEADR